MPKERTTKPEYQFVPYPKTVADMRKASRVDRGHSGANTYRAQGRRLPAGVKLNDNLHLHHPSGLTALPSSISLATTRNAEGAAAVDSLDVADPIANVVGHQPTESSPAGPPPPPLPLPVGHSSVGHSSNLFRGYHLDSSVDNQHRHAIFFSSFRIVPNLFALSL